MGVSTRDNLSSSISCHSIPSVVFVGFLSFPVQVGYAMTTYHHGTHKPVIGFDMGGQCGEVSRVCDLMTSFHLLFGSDCGWG